MGKNKEKDSKIIDINDLTKAVNKFDKSFGLDLKHPEAWSKPNKFLPVYEANTELSVAKLIAGINGINLEEFYNDDFMNAMGIELFPMNPNSDEFCEQSCLEWTNDKTYNTQTLQWRTKFLTCVLSEYMGRLERIATRKAEVRWKSSHSMTEKIIMMIKELLKHIDTFVKCVIYNKSFKNAILLINDDLLFTRKYVNKAKLKKRLVPMIIDTRTNLQKSLLKERFMEDDIAINNILQIAYMLVTLDHNSNRGVPKFDLIEGDTLEYNQINLIERLGIGIIKKTYKKSRYRISPLFRAFLKAKPKVMSQFHEEEKDSLPIHIGIMALEFTKFFMCDKNVTNFINEMLTKRNKK